MGRSLFQLEDTFVESVCFGLDDAEVQGKVIGALEDGRLELQRSVRTRVRRSPMFRQHADEIDVVLRDGSYVVTAPDEVEGDLLDNEYGLGERPLPLLRPGLVRGRFEAQRAITQGLELS